MGSIELDQKLRDAIRARAEPGVIDELLRAGANPESIASPDDGRFRPLHFAVYEAKSDMLEVVRHLLERGAEPNALASGGQSPLLVALGSVFRPGLENADLIRSLLDAGADPNHANELGHTPLMYAAATTLCGARLLLEAGATAAAKDRDGWTALDWAWGEEPVQALADLAGVTLSRETYDQFLKRETPRVVDWHECDTDVRPADPVRTAAYFASGYTVLDYGDVHPDDSVLTDGLWAWSWGIADRVRRGKARIPPDCAAFLEARSYRMPFLDPMKLYLKTVFLIREYGATYAMPWSMYDYLHYFLCDRAGRKPRPMPKDG